jgi:hypothetical protein
MAVRIALVPPGARVRVRRGSLPIEPALVGSLGTVVGTTSYRAERVDVALDGTGEVRQFSPAELEVLQPFALLEDRQAASRRRALP